MVKKNCPHECEDRQCSILLLKCYPKSLQAAFFFAFINSWFVNSTIFQYCFFATNIAVNTRNKYFIKTDFFTIRKNGFQHWCCIAFSSFVGFYRISDMSTEFRKIVIKIMAHLYHPDKAIISFANVEKLCCHN